MKLPKNDREWRATTGFDEKRFHKLLDLFTDSYKELFGTDMSSRHEGLPTQLTFSSCESLLFYTLFTLKSGVTYDVLGFIFGLDVSNAKKNQTLGLKVLCHGLEKADYMPKREFSSPEEMAAYFKEHSKLILDGQEQRIQRPKGKERQKDYYSGKKKRIPLNV
jgi:hypothetical protein